jgi:hypothetical protein
MLALPVSDELVAAIAERAAELVAERLEREASPWMTRPEAARYLGLPESRLEKDAATPRDPAKRKKKGPPKIPLHRDGARVLYHRDELDRWLLEA